MTRYIAHITIQADTPLKVGSNNSDFLQDSPVQKDWNGLPMILGTSIAGVLRKDFGSNDDEIFGKEDGSKVIFSNALLLDENNKVNEELLLEKSPFLKIFDNLPIREHTAITAKGVAKEHSKFDEEVVYKGSRFKFSIEMIEDKNSFEKILNLLNLPSFRLGGGSTKGFGKFKIESIKTKEFNESNYNGYSSSLNDFDGKEYQTKTCETNYNIYTLKIKPDDFFMFGSGFGDDDADMTPVYERAIDYKNGKLSDDMILIPASSIKGAIAHRTAYHYNKLQGNTIENGKGIEKVKTIFGEEKNSKKDIEGSKGKLLISDCFKSQNSTKTFDHVSIDRFTGGAIDGALFQEKTIADNREYEIEILLEKSLDNSDEQKAFESTLTDITTGMLSLGGATTKGHGVFIGNWSKS
jgi:CRISPR/Cas system CSM-associated protein Csm3 (group 7 of RAMP superfamily)